MFVQIEALYVDSDGVNYDGMGITAPEELLEFAPLWVNLSAICFFEAAANTPGETVISLSNGKQLQINMSEDNFLLLLDTVGMIPEVGKLYTKAVATINEQHRDNS
jgi:hypothetical protein